jgi:hypothetical protein
MEIQPFEVSFFIQSHSIPFATILLHFLIYILQRKVLRKLAYSLLKKLAQIALIRAF